MTRFDDEFVEVTHAPPPPEPRDDSRALVARTRAIMRSDDPAIRAHVAAMYENAELRGEVERLRAPRPRPVGDSDAGKGVARAGAPQSSSLAAIVRLLIRP